MSFLLHYNGPFNTLKLLVYVGQDGELYLSAANISILLGRRRRFSSKLPGLRLKEAMPCCSLPYSRRWIVPYNYGVAILKKSKCPVVQKFGSQLENPAVQVLCVIKHDPSQLHHPTRLILDCPHNDSQLFCTWIYFFKEEVLNKLYNEPREDGSELLRTFGNYGNITPVPDLDDLQEIEFGVKPPENICLEFYGIKSKYSLVK